MPTREEILEGISNENYDLAEIAEFIRQGVISKSDISSILSPLAKKRIDSLLDQPTPPNPPEPPQTTPPDPPKPPVSDEESDWEAAVAQNTIESYNGYLPKYRSGKHRSKAFDAIDRLSGSNPNPETGTNPVWAMGMDDLKEKLQKSNKPADDIAQYLADNSITKSSLLQEIRSSHNWLHIETIQQLMQRNILNVDDLVSLGLDNDTVRKVIRWVPDDTEIDAKPVEPILKPCTEYYFWGIPGSGKSCAMGAIMSCVNNLPESKGRMMADSSCQGSAYMDVLANAFVKDRYVDFPPRTRTEAISEMSFDLYPADKPKKYIPITCVDLAGEIIRIMYKKETGLWCSRFELDALDSLHLILPQYHDKKSVKRSGEGNRKYHYFVVECGAEDKGIELQVTESGKRIKIKQAQLLDKAMGYIKKTNILAKATNGIGILLTKADQLPVPAGSTLAAEASDYVDRCYRGVVGNIKILLNQNGIAGGRLPVIPFSVGDVWFQQLCKFNDRYAKIVVDEFLKQQPLPIKKGLEG